MAQRLHIGIVGGGVAGCAAALWLARDGHDVELLERTPRIGPVGAGILLQPGGQRVLGEMGLLDAVAARAARIDALVAWTHRGRSLSRLAYADHAPGRHAPRLFALGVHRADLFAPLHAACVAAGVRVRLGHDIDATRRTPCGRTLERRAIQRSRELARAIASKLAATRQRRDAERPPPLIRDGATVGTYDLVVAADGARSRLRASGGLRAIHHAYRPAALWAVGHSVAPVDQLVQYTRGNAELCGLLPMGGGRCSFFWGIDARDLCRRDTSLCGRPRGSFDAWRDRVRRLAPMAGPLLETLRGWDDLMVATYHATLMPRVTADRLVFIGDAAHASGPHLGQGANLALMDATALRDALRASRSLPAALEQYNAAQRWRNAWYSATTAALMPSFQGSLFGLGPARDVVLPLLQRVGPIRRLMLRTLCGVW